jgi:glycosyltransferase involved in cell wall biosynthesis
MIAGLSKPAGSQDRPSLKVFSTANKRHGGFRSVCTLMTRLRLHFHVTVYPLFKEVPEDNSRTLRSVADCVGEAGIIPDLDPGDHVLFYMNEYTTLIGNFSDRWQQVLGKAASVQVVLNRTVGGLQLQHWMSDVVQRIYFHDSLMESTWVFLTRDSPLAGIRTGVLPPPVELDEFFSLASRRPPPPPVVVGRLAGDSDLPGNAASFYGQLAAALPEAEFWFMPAPEDLRHALGDNRRFRFFEKDEISVDVFLSSCHIYALTYATHVPVPGPRSLLEAMAAGCAPVVIDRDGPRDRVVHDESGFRTNDDDERIDYIVRLTTDAALRERISRGAVARARKFDPDTWIDAIVAHSIGTG